MQNRMVVVGLQDGTLNTFTYDATGLRRKSQAGAATTNFVLDGQDVLLETDGSGVTQVGYTHGPGTYGPLITQRRGGSSIFHHFDALGSTTEVTDAAGTVTDTDRYYAFGETRASTGSTTNPFGFVGRLGYYTEPTLALQYLRARWYQPAAGRFTSQDPIDGFPARPITAHGYLYALNAPVVRLDPSGLFDWGVFGLCMLTTFVGCQAMAAYVFTECYSGGHLICFAIGLFDPPAGIACEAALLVVCTAAAAGTLAGCMIGGLIACIQNALDAQQGASSHPCPQPQPTGGGW